MNNIVIGKRIPIGAAVGGIIAFLAEIWNVTNPDAQLGAAAVTGFSTAVVALVQILVVNTLGISQPDKK